MRVGVPVHEGRISPLFDEARALLMVDVASGDVIDRREERLDRLDPIGRARRVMALGVQVLICGAISQQLERLLLSGGVLVIPNTCGPVGSVLRTFAAGKLTERALLMPGCRGRRRRRARHRHGRGGRG